ncbi:hypothetical protein ACIA78_17540 [Streptomyces xanthochromogenes]|uniref:hypothetical protein n=1 Tax=Streptomyces xanthochromogenes TaxID=67384 RepID=UPI0037AF899D
MTPQPPCTETAGCGQLALDGIPAAPATAASAGRAVVARKTSAEGRPFTLVRPDQHPPARSGHGVVVSGWLRIVAPASWTGPVGARCWCVCGYERDATGRAAVLQLVAAHGEHLTSCPLLHPISEGRAAA